MSRTTLYVDVSMTIGGLWPPSPSNEPASGPSASPWPWQGGPSFFFRSRLPAL